MKIDLHTHSYYSYDGVFSPESLIRGALKKGLDGIALTDHDTTAGWKEAVEAAKKLGAVLVLGEEIRVKEKGKTVVEILGYFLKEEISGEGKRIEEVVDEIKNQGGIAVIAHPFNWRKVFNDLEKYKYIADGVEAFNARSQTSKGNKKSMEFAKDNNLVATAGSDAHSPFEIGNAYVESRAKNLEELKAAILNKEIEIVAKQGGFSLFPALGKLLHLFWRPKQK